MDQNKYIIFYPPLKTTTTINSFNVRVMDLKLNTSVQISVSLFTIDEQFISRRIYTLEGDDYMSWGSDDKYIIDWVKNKLQIDGLLVN